jgi:hypothetical protein
MIYPPILHPPSWFMRLLDTTQQQPLTAS